MKFSPYHLLLLTCTGIAATIIGPARAAATPPPIVFDAARHTPAGGNPVALVAADFDGDGRPDLAVSNSSTHDVSILLGHGDGTFSAVTPAILSPHAGAIAAADFNGDGREDLVAADWSGHSVVVAFGSGGGLFGPGTTYDAGMGAFFVATGDFNGDHKPDIMVGGPYFGVSVLLNLGNGAMATRTIVYPDDPPPAWGGESTYGVGDLDGDGLDDILSAGWESCCGEPEGQGFKFYRNLGNGSFAASFVDGTYYPSDLEIVDWDHDGRRDVAVLGIDAYVLVNRNLGGGSFSAPGPILFVPDSSAAMTAADYNGDGIPDLALGQDGQALVVLKAGLGDGTLGADTPLTLADTFGTFQRIVVADFNGDGWPDLSVVEQNLGSVAVYLNLSAPPPPPSAGEAAKDPDLIQVTAYDPATGMLSFTYGPACQATGHSVVLGDLFAPVRGAYSSMVCGLGTSGAASFNPGSDSVFFLVVGDNGTSAGSYGLTSDGIERPTATGLGACDLPQALGACP